MPFVFVIVGTLLLASSVFLGAYGTHGLYEAGAAASEVRGWDWANQMHVAHSLGLVVIGLMLRRQPGILFYKLAGWLLIAGVVLFSFTIYLKTLGGPDLAVADALWWNDAGACVAVRHHRRLVRLPIVIHPLERGRPALVEGETPSLPACSLRASAAAPAAKTPSAFPQALVLRGTNRKISRWRVLGRRLR